MLAVSAMDLADLVKLLDDREDEEGCYQTDAHECSPYDAEVHVPHVTWDRHELVAQGCSHNPATPHHTAILGRRYLGQQ